MRAPDRHGLDPWPDLSAPSTLPMPRFICPHCHHPLDADALEVVRCGAMRALACPCCDELIPQPPQEAPPNAHPGLEAASEPAAVPVEQP